MIHILHSVMNRQIIESTDDKYVGLIFDPDKPLMSPDGIAFNPTEIQELEHGLIRYANSHYVILTAPTELDPTEVTIDDNG